MTTAWTGDWRKRVLERVREMGYQSVSDYLKARPGVPYLDLAEELSRPLAGGEYGDVAAVQIEELQYLEAESEGKLREAAMDSLVRILRDRLGQGGWNEGAGADFKRAWAYASWSGLVSRCGEDRVAEAYADKTWEALKELSPPRGWLPSSPEDPYVVAAFNKGWPENEGT